jgi:hypothetical protein
MATAAPSKTTTRQYGLYKNLGPTSISIDNLNTIIADLAVADASHDFGGKVTSITTILEPGSSGYLHKAYNGGHPKENTTIPNEDQAILSVFKSKDPLQIPLNKIKLIHSDPTKKVESWSQETINGHKYTARFCNVKPESGAVSKYIDAETFFDTLGFKDEIQETLAFVIDETSISIDDILTSGKKLKKRSYLIKASEIENDPGGKKKLHDTMFSDTYKSRGTNFTPAIPFNINNNTEYYYTFDSSNKNNSPMCQFFTNYTFKISELEYENKYISSKLSTTLQIVSNQPKVSTRIIHDSGDCNEINYLAESMNNILGKKTLNVNEKFELASSFQQKRSGDWLQALLCCSIANGSRQFCEYIRPKNNNAKKNLAALQQSAPLDFTKVFLVTHDRILLAFALLLGIDVMFAHHYSPEKDKPSKSSLLMYTITNPNEELNNKKNFMNKFLDLWRESPTKNYFNTLTKNKLTLNTYKQQIETINDNNKIDLDSNITTATTNLINNNYDDFNKNTQAIFKSAIKYNIVKTYLPDFTIVTDKITKFLLDNNDFFYIFPKFSIKTNLESSELVTPVGADTYPTYINEDDINLNFQLKDDSSKTFTITYDKALRIKREYDNLLSECNACIEQFKSHPIGSDTNAYNNTIKKKLSSDPYYLLAMDWKISNNPKINLWQEYTITIKSGAKSKTISCINDKNKFLYYLSKLNKESKEKINNYYYSWYTKLVGTPPVNNFNMPERLVDKLKSTMLSFCLEVLMNTDYIYQVPPGTPPPAIQVINTDLKKNIDAILSKIKDLNKKIVAIPAAALPNTTTEDKELIVFNDNFVDASQSRINTIVNEQVALDTIVVDTATNENRLTLLPSINTINVNNSSSILDEAINIKYPEDKEYNLNITPSNVVIPMEIDDLTLPSVGGGIQFGGNNEKYKFLLDYKNVKAPIYLNLVNLFSHKIIDTSNNVTIEDYLMYYFNILRSDESDSDRNTKFINYMNQYNINPDSDLVLKEFINKITSTIFPEQKGGVVNTEKIQLFKEKFYKNLESKRTAFEKEESEARSEAPDFKTEKLSVSKELDSIFINDRITFHPLLPILMIVRSYYFQIINVPIEDLWDYELYISYYYVLCSIIKKLVESYSNENNTNENKFIALINGYGFRELFFTSNQYSERDETCMTALNVEPKMYYQFSSLNSIFSNMAFGELNQSEEDINFGSLCISNPIFTSFMTDINIKNYFNLTTTMIVGQDFRADVLNLYLNIGKKISNDQTGIISTEVDNYLMNTGLVTTIISSPIPATTYSIDNLIDKPFQLVEPVGGNKKTRRKSKKLRKNTTRSKKQSGKNTTLRIKNRKKKKFTR